VNRLTALPPEIGQLMALRRLDLGDNQLTALPSEIGQLTALEELYLRVNQLTALPREIGRLTSLQQLNLNSNQLKALPPEIGWLTALQQLNLNSNQLKALPPEIGQLTVQELDLSGNHLTVLPPEIRLVTALRSLDLRDNQLKALPPGIGQLTMLQRLYLSVNQLMALPPEIGQLTALQSLHLSVNQLTVLPPEIGQLTALRSLDLRDNQLRVLPPEIGQLTALENLDLRDNPLPEPYRGFIALAQPRATTTVLDYLRDKFVGKLDEQLTPVEGALSPVDFTVSRGRPIRAKPSADVQPIFNTPTERRDHKPRLDLCRATAASLLKMLEQKRYNVREGYRHVLLDYIKYLPPNIRNRNLLFADQEARILRDLFAEDAAALPLEFASRLKALLQAHMALRVFYPRLQRFYDDVRFGRSDPLPIDAAERVSAIVGESAEIFDRSVGLALADAAPPLPATSISVVSANEATALAPPPDLLGTLPSEKAQGYMRAGTINRLYPAFLKGEALNRNSEAWAKMGERLIAHVRPVIEWLSSFLSGPPTT
jgi:Leucine rich repeat